MSNLLNKISNEEIADLPLKSFEGEIVNIENSELAIECAKELLNEKVLGFDTESKPAFKKGEFNHVCMIQLSTENKSYIFRNHLFEIPKEIIQIFEDENIIKAGAAIRDDIKDLQKLKSFTPKGFVEIQQMAKNVGSQNFGLRSMAALFLKIRISKGAKLTNWENKVLTEQQLNYAATDAWLGIRLYKTISKLAPKE